jgi:hypothetical protein
MTSLAVFGRGGAAIPYGRSADRNPRTIAGSGMLSRHVTQRSGNSSILDIKNINENIKKHSENLKSNYRIGFFDEFGKAVDDPVYVHNGRAYYSRDGKTIAFADRESLDYKKGIAEEIDKAVDEIIPYCLYNDELAMEALVLEDKEYESLLSSATDSRIPMSLRNANGTAEYLDAVAGDTKEYSLGLARLRYVAKHFCTTILEGGTKTLQLVEKDDVGK